LGGEQRGDGRTPGVAGRGSRAGSDAVYDAKFSSTGSGIGLASCIDFVAAAFGVTAEPRWSKGTSGRSWWTASTTRGSTGRRSPARRRPREGRGHRASALCYARRPLRGGRQGLSSLPCSPEGSPRRSTGRKPCAPDATRTSPSRRRPSRYGRGRSVPPHPGSPPCLSSLTRSRSSRTSRRTTRGAPDPSVRSHPVRRARDRDRRDRPEGVVLECWRGELSRARWCGSGWAADARERAPAGVAAAAPGARERGSTRIGDTTRSRASSSPRAELR
jgi:hypothetical protein